ncbi:MAG TPA: glycosyltransferase [Microscillaceae bacterium]|nr:glycosyltransferase [Microscillaceae bacterium]
MKAAKPLLSIVSPVYRAEKIVDLLVERITNEVNKISENFEIILVEDGSPDNSWQAIERNCQQDKRVVGIKLSRNFGQHYAITAGIDHAQGEWVVVMDCDLQDRPEEIINLYNKAQEGYDVVLARRDKRRDSWLKRLFSWTFYKLLFYLSGISHDTKVANFGIYHIKVIRAICQMQDHIKFLPTMVQWIGFRQIKLNIQHAERKEGKTSYKPFHLFNLALNILLINSNKLLTLIIYTGGIITLGTAFYVIYEILAAPKILVLSGILYSVWFLGGLIIMAIGVLGLYIGKIHNGVKKRPVYIVKEELNSVR